MLLSQPEYQKLLGLALSTTFGKPLRYCIQHEIVPAASYWTYYADQLESSPVTQVLNSLSVALLIFSTKVYCFFFKDWEQYCCCNCGFI